MAKIHRYLQKACIQLLKFYQRWISPCLGDRCRFYPSCSEYTISAIRQRGLFLGFLLMFWRLLRCHPFHPGGHDPLPDEKK